MTDRSITIYYDYVSPFAYIASEVLPGFGGRRGVTFDWRPIELLRLSNFAGGLPYSPSKRAYVAVDAVRSAEMRGIPIRMPKPFPVQSALALRLAAVARERGVFDAIHHSLYRAAWRERRDISAEGVLSELIAAAGGDPPEWLATARAPAADESVAANTAEAEAAGVFGVPTMVLDGELFWGIDSLAALEWRLSKRPE